MMALSKEVLRPSPEEQAEEAVEGYIERVEKKPEIAADVQQWVKPGSGSVTLPQVNDFGQMVQQQAQQQQKPITLPLTQDELKDGLHHKIIDSVRWLAEWSIRMIKRYPGRVFYKA